ncbi:endochitinase [Ephemerocybe angulata]|uniref:Endochitinase n=1 Tax=Ephemerocybe angulata TaxID=980116 RepID=A0A8H6IES8_9AGAR|nr:endochitinase [Tulosesus angulatus]
MAHPGEHIEARAPEKPIAAAWYAGWHAADFPLSAVSWSKYTHMTYAFGVTTPDPNIIGLDISDENRLPQFVSSAHNHSVKALLSVGGWTGSRYFSTAVGSAKNRTAFAKAITSILQKYDLDGIDFDWEYPGKQGIGCNIVNPNDTSNFLLFLQQLRQDTTLKRTLVLTAAVYVTPFADNTGEPSSNISGFADVLDYIAIMNYDLKSNPAIGVGPSSPLDDSCAPSGAKLGSAVSSVAAWSNAGIPNNKLVLGVGAYGHSYDISSAVALSRTNSSSLNSYPSYTPNSRSLGDRWDGDSGVDVCGVMQAPGGVYTYWGLIEEGFLKSDGSAGEGIALRYDDCSETPFAYNATSQVYVSYENPRSFAAKGDFIHSNGLAGFAMWEAGGDYHDVLLDSIKNASQNGNPGSRTQKASLVSGTSSKGSSSAASTRPASLVFVLLPALVFLSTLISVSSWPIYVLL